MRGWNDVDILVVRDYAAICSDDALEGLCQARVLLSVALQEAVGATPFTLLTARIDACARVWVGSAGIGNAPVVAKFH